MNYLYLIFGFSDLQRQASDFSSTVIPKIVRMDYSSRAFRSRIDLGAMDLFDLRSKGINGGRHQHGGSAADRCESSEFGFGRPLSITPTHEAASTPHQRRLTAKRALNRA